MNFDYHIDLFSGIGGFSLGLRRAGFKFKHYYYSEIDKYAIQIYRRFYQKAESLGRVESIQPGRIKGNTGIFTFGFPCQDLSIAGKRAGIKGTRSQLFFKGMDIIAELRPNYYIWENVMGILSSNDGKDIEIIINEMYSRGYIFDLIEMNTKWFLPQNRQRIYCIGVDLIWIGKLLIEDTKNGTKENYNLYEKIIKGYLLSKLQQNLEGLQRVHELKSINLVFAYLIKEKLTLNGQILRSRYLEIISKWDLKDLKNLYRDTQEWLLKQKDIKQDSYINQSLEEILMDISGGQQLTAKEKLLLCIELLWRNLSDENLIKANLFTISIIIKQTTPSKIFTCVETENIMQLYIDRLKNLYRSLWKKALLNLIKEQEDMKYAEIRRNKSKGNEEKNTLTIPFNDEPTNKNDTFGHPGDGRRPEIFSFGESYSENEPENLQQAQISGTINPKNNSGQLGFDSGTTLIMDKKLNKKNTDIAAALTGGGHSGGNHSDMDLIQIGNIGGSDQGGRVYDSKGIAKTLTGCGGGMGAKTGLYAVASRTREGKQSLEQRKDDVANSITSVQTDSMIKVHNFQPRSPDRPSLKKKPGSGGHGHLSKKDGNVYPVNPGNTQAVEMGTQIRRLTPVECERLQGFPDNWTKYGIDDNGNQVEISDTQRYKTLGNAVSVPVVKWVAEHITNKQEHV